MNEPTAPSIRIARAVGWSAWVTSVIMGVVYTVNPDAHVSPWLIILGAATAFITSLPKREPTNGE